MGKFIGAGNTIQHTPGSAVTAGDVILIGDKICVAKNNIAVGDVGELDTNGEFEWPIDGATAFAQGVKIFWDVADQEATEAEDTGTNKLIGYTTKSALAADVVIRGYLENGVT